MNQMGQIQDIGEWTVAHDPVDKMRINGGKVIQKANRKVERRPVDPNKSRLPCG